MVSRVFVTALSLVSALAQALIYGLGGYLAVTGRIEPGTVVTMALLLTRLYTPMTALANARVDVMTALVSFERVFEVLDLQPMIIERPDARWRCRAGPVVVRLRGVRFGYPSAEKVSLASLEDVAVLDTRDGGRGAARRRPRGRTPAGWSRWSARPGRASRRSPRWCPGSTTSTPARSSWPAIDVRHLASPRSGTRSAWSPRTGTCSTTRSRPTCATRPQRPPTPRSSTRCVGPVSAICWTTPAGRPGHRGGRARLPPLRRRAAAVDHRPAAAGPPRVVILDEATAHLDSESEAAVQAALAEALAGRTAIVIAHRLSTVRAADQIAVVEHGRIVERGPHDQLLAAGGRYAELYRTQFADRRRPGRGRRGRLWARRLHRLVTPGRGRGVSAPRWARRRARTARPGQRRTAPSTRSSTVSSAATSSEVGGPVASRASSPSSTSSR